MKIVGFIFLTVMTLVSALLCLSEIKEEDDIYLDIMKDNHDNDN